MTVDQQIVNIPDYGDNLALTVGVSYVAGFFAGIVKGTVLGMPKNSRLPTKLKMNNMINSIGMHTSKVGNSFGCASALYFIMGKGLNVLFQDQLDSLSQLQKNVLCGAATGALYKSTLGFIPSCFGAALGCVIAGTLHFATQYGNQNGLIGFEMKF